MALNSKDLILLTGNYKDFFGKFYQSNKIKFEEIINFLKNNLANNIYFEIENVMKKMKNFENFILNQSRSLRIPLIATQEVYYLNKEMYDARDALTCIGQKEFIDDKNRFKYSQEHYLKNVDELVNLYSDILL